MRKVAAVQKEINDQHGKNREGNRDIQGALERERVAATFEQKEDQREANRKKGTSKEKNQCRNQKEQENPQEKKREKEKRRIWILTKTDHDKCGGNVGGDRGPAGDEQRERGREAERQKKENKQRERERKGEKADIDTYKDDHDKGGGNVGGD